MRSSADITLIDQVRDVMRNIKFDIGGLLTLKTMTHDKKTHVM